MGSVKALKSGVIDLWSITQAFQGIWQLLVISGLSVGAEMMIAKAGASPVEATVIAITFAFLLVLCLIAYRLYWLNVYMEFKPSEHTSFFYEWGKPSQDEEMIAAFYSKSTTQSTVARVRLRIYGGDTVEGVKVILTNVKDCPELNGLLPFSLRFKDDNCTPHKTCLDLNAEDDQFVDVASWIWDSKCHPAIVFHRAIGDIEVPLKEYEITLRLTGKGIRSDTKRFWIGIAKENKPELGLREGLFSMRALDN